MPTGAWTFWRPTGSVALSSPAYADPSRPVNLARFAFLDPQATALYPHWDDVANTTVAMLRTEAGRNPYDRGLSDLIGELSTRSETFRNRWAAHNVRLHRPAPNSSITPSSATSASPTRSWNSRPTPV